MSSELIRRVVALLAPPSCVVCRAPVGAEEWTCRRCGCELLGLPRGDSAAFEYAGPARAMVVALKFNGATALAGEMAGLMTRRIPEQLAGAEWIVPAPAHPRRRRVRGYNQSQLLAAELSRLTGARVLDCLTRAGGGSPQSELSRGERLAMQRNSIRVDPRALRRAGIDPLAEFPTNVVVCDDVRTTGVTLEICAQAIRERQPELGSEPIRAAVFASARVSGTTDRIARRQSRRPTG
ncbi:MAG: hypothetical protein QM648_10990 [Solirubrobacterales bacterium]